MSALAERLSILLDTLEPELLAVAAFVAIAALILAAVTATRLSLFQRRLLRLLGRRGRSASGPPGAESVLLVQAHQIEELKAELLGLSAAMERANSRLQAAVQGVGVVRFNAFSDTGSDLSFAVALVDAEGTGVVLSSLYGRDESRVYAKPLVKQVSPYPLSDEEKQAIDTAMRILPR